VPSRFPTSTGSFADKAELQTAITDAAAAGYNPTAQVYLDYGYPMSAWDVSGIQNFDFLFQGYNGDSFDLNGWDTSQVTSMTFMVRKLEIILYCLLSTT